MKYQMFVNRLREKGYLVTCRYTMPRIIAMQEDTGSVFLIQPISQINRNISEQKRLMALARKYNAVPLVLTTRRTNKRGVKKYFTKKLCAVNDFEKFELYDV